MIRVCVSANTKFAEITQSRKAEILSWPLLSFSFIKSHISKYAKNPTSGHPPPPHPGLCGVHSWSAEWLAWSLSPWGSPHWEENSSKTNQPTSLWANKGGWGGGTVSVRPGLGTLSSYLMSRKWLKAPCLSFLVYKTGTIMPASWCDEKLWGWQLSVLWPSEMEP